VTLTKFSLKSTKDKLHTLPMMLSATAYCSRVNASAFWSPRIGSRSHQARAFIASLRDNIYAFILIMFSNGYRYRKTRTQPYRVLYKAHRD